MFQEVNVTRILHIDQMNLFIRCFASLPFTNDQGEHVGALFGCLNSYCSLIKKFEPDIVLVAWEGKDSSKRRRDLMPEYKGGRKFHGFNKSVFGDDVEAETKALQNQLTRLKQYITNLPFYQASIDYLEADDLIGYSVEHLFNDEENFQNIIVSYDRDYVQLVGKGTALYRPVKSKDYPKGQFCTEDSVIEEMGCHPRNYLIVKCIVGDTSDAINGISGVGIKTVAKDFECLRALKNGTDIYTTEDIFDICDCKLAEDPKKNKKYGKYLEHRELIERNYKLMQLLDPNISITSVQAIERTFTNFVPKFKNTSFRLMLVKDSIAPRNITSWIDALTNIHPKSISFE